MYIFKNLKLFSKLFLNLQIYNLNDVWQRYRLLLLKIKRLSQSSFYFIIDHLYDKNKQMYKTFNMIYDNHLFYSMIIIIILFSY